MTLIKILRTWKGGPLRQMSATNATNAFIPFAITIEGCNYAGRYVCDCCNHPCSGVILRTLQNVGKNVGNRPSGESLDCQGWVCDVCEKGGTRKVQSEAQKQAVIDRLTAARATRTARGGRLCRLNLKWRLTRVFSQSAYQRGSEHP